MTKNPGVIMVDDDSRLNPMVTLELRLSKVNTINALLERDKAKLLNPFETNETLGYMCPICGTIFAEHAINEYKFCYNCGQRFSERELWF